MPFLQRSQRKGSLLEEVSVCSIENGELWTHVCFVPVVIERR